MAADITSELESLENRLMRAWGAGDRASVKANVASDCVMMFGTAPPVLPARASFIAASEKGLVLRGYRLREMMARTHGRLAWFTGHVELDLELGRHSWKGGFLLTDLFRKTAIKRRWKLAERSLAPVEPDEVLSGALRKLQLWA